MILVFLGALVAEFLVLENTLGISLPSDRYRAQSTAEISTKGLEQHSITRNYQFTVIGSGSDAMVLREYFFTDKTDFKEGPPKATVTVDGMANGRAKWSFTEPGQRGDVLTDNVYRVVRPSNGETPNIYTYFSLRDGRKVRTTQNVELSRDDLIALDGALSK